MAVDIIQCYPLLLTLTAFKNFVWKILPSLQTPLIALQSKSVTLCNEACMQSSQQQCVITSLQTVIDCSLTWLQTFIDHSLTL